MLPIGRAETSVVVMLEGLQLFCCFGKTSPFAQCSVHGVERFAYDLTWRLMGEIYSLHHVLGGIENYDSRRISFLVDSFKPLLDRCKFAALWHKRGKKVPNVKDKNTRRDQHVFPPVHIYFANSGSPHTKHKPFFLLFSENHRILSSL
jgi:hypothetical protein